MAVALVVLELGSLILLFVFVVVFVDADTIDESKTGPPLGPVEDCVWLWFEVEDGRELLFDEFTALILK